MKIVKVTTTRPYDSAQMEKLQYIMEKQLGADYKVVLMPDGSDAQIIDDRTLRDEFAIAAITGMLARGEETTAKHYATNAYLIADAALEARNANR